jgi:hypothetical protein
MLILLAHLVAQSILLNTFFQYASYMRNDEKNLVAIDFDVVINHHLMWCHVDVS